MAVAKSKEELLKMKGKGLYEKYARKEGVLEFLAEVIPQGYLFDPMAGTGSIADMKRYGWKGFVWANDMINWNGYYSSFVDKWTHFDAVDMPIENDTFDIVFVNPPCGVFLDFDDDLVTIVKDENGDPIYYGSESLLYGERLPKNNLCDISTLCPEFMKISAKIIQECLRVLKKSGFLVIECVCDHSEEFGPADILDLYKRYLKGLGYPINYSYQYYLDPVKNDIKMDSAYETVYLVKK